MEINKLIREIRGRDSLREAAEKTGISYTYWSILEKGVDPRTKSPIKPSPDTLRSISEGYKYDYEDLMKAAGYIDHAKEEPTKYIINDQAKNAAIEAYNRLPPDKKKLVDDMIKALSDK